MKILDTEQLVLARYDDNGNLVPLTESETKWLKIFSSQWEHKNKQGRWMFVSRGDPVEPDEKKPDAVIIAATYTLMGKPHLILTSEFRVPVRGYEIGFPAGLINEGETVEDAAKREFKEETGLDLDIQYRSPPNLVSSAGMMNETVQIVFGKATGVISSDGLEGSEDIKVIVADYEFVSQLVDNWGVSIGAKAWPILLMLKQLFQEEQEIEIPAFRTGEK